VKLLLSFPGTDCNAADSEGMAPLHYAVLCDDLDIVSLLLASGADPRQADASGDTPLDAADGAAMKALLTSGAESA
jgi:ankyrin repeat protein